MTIPKKKAKSEVGALKQKLFQLGFTDRAYNDLSKLVADNSSRPIQKAAAWELALWHANQYTKEDARQCLKMLDIAMQDEHNEMRQRRASVFKAECYDVLGDLKAGKEEVEYALSSAPHPDLYFAAANLEPHMETRLEYINKAFEYCGTSKIFLEPVSGCPPYDGLRPAPDLERHQEEKIDLPRVSIIVPAYNSEKTISTSLDSILQQTWQNFEVLVVDDCSADSTAKIGRSYEQKDSRVKLLKTKKNQGPYVARNIALQLATGDFVTCNDADDWSHPAKIEIQARELINNKDIVACISRWCRVTNELKFYRRGNAGFYIQVNLSSLMFRREQVGSALGYWDSVRFGADSEFWDRMKKVFDNQAIKEISAVLSFARSSKGSLTENSAFGFPGYPMGARKYYHEAYMAHHETTESLYYQYPMAVRPFPIPEIMSPSKNSDASSARHFNVVFASDFRQGEAYLPVNEIRKIKNTGMKIGLFQMARYHADPATRISPEIIACIDGAQVQIVVFGEKISCDVLIVRDFEVLKERQQYIPEVKSKDVCVVLTDRGFQNSRIDTDSDIRQCVRHLDAYFGKGLWCPANRRIRKSLKALPPQALSTIELTKKNWPPKNLFVQLAGVDNYNFKTTMNKLFSFRRRAWRDRIIKPIERRFVLPKTSKGPLVKESVFKKFNSFKAWYTNKFRRLKNKSKSGKEVNDGVVLIDVKDIDKFEYKKDGGIAVIMPCIDIKKGVEAANFLYKRAGIACKIIVVNDSLRKGFISVLNSTAAKTHVKYIVYLAQDAYPGVDWLKSAHETLEVSGNGLLAFNDGKWRGRIAAFGMVRLVWVKSLYGGHVFYAGYKAHKADNELTVIARIQNTFSYNPDCTLVEIDKEKVFKENVPEDKELFHKRFRSGFDGLLPVESLASLAAEYFVPWDGKQLKKHHQNMAQNHRATLICAAAKQNLPEKCFLNNLLVNEYIEKGLDTVPDTFVLYRIVGNDLYPRHKKGQTRENLKFILENEPGFEGCEKRFVVNRIIDREEESAIIELLKRYGCSYLHIPFVSDEYRKIEYDTECLPAPGYLSSKEFASLHKTQQDRAILAVYRFKNNYIMNNNGARNKALKDGLSRAKWVLPWDGNCFITEGAWEKISNDIKSSPHLKYFAVPMARVETNADLLKDNFIPNPVEEPQLVFRSDAREDFNEGYCYGRRPKVELLWRLGIPGKWDHYPADDEWDLKRLPLSRDAGQFGFAGWVARLYSGMKEMEQDNTESVRKRVLARVDAIITTINHADAMVSGWAPENMSNFDPVKLEEERKICNSNDNALLRNLMEKLIVYADEALQRGPFSVTDKTSLPPGGKKNDYWHPAPYWWPNPETKNGLPYIRKDGERVPGTRMHEPASEKYDRTRLQRVFDDSTILALAWKFTGNPKYAAHAVGILERFFVEPKTRMNPHLMYGQVRMGHNQNKGSSSGIIETKDMYYYLDAVRILKDSKFLSENSLGKFQEWLDEFLKWLLTSPQGKTECTAKNNHGTCYDLQVASIAAFIDNKSVLFETLVRAQSRIAQQFSPDGTQPHEMDRTITTHYCCFNFQNWINLAEMASMCNVNLWEYKTQNGAGLVRSAEWLIRHMGEKWPYKQIEEFDCERFLPIWFSARSRVNAEPAVNAESAWKDLPASKYEVKPVFFPHDGIRPFWNLGSRC